MSNDMLGVSVHDAQGVIADLLQKLGGPNGNVWLASSKRFLRMQCVWGRASNMPIWNTVTLGRHKTAEAYREILLHHGYRICPNAGAQIILDNPKFSCAQEETSVDLVALSSHELGIEHNADMADYFEICEEAIARGLQLCPPEVGPALRFSVALSARKRFIIGMEGIMAEHFNEPLTFVLHQTKEGEKRLVSAYANPIVARDSLFVFVRPRS